jgi:hypothetical protein
MSPPPVPAGAEVGRTAEALAAADQEWQAAQAALARLEHAWAWGLPDPDAATSGPAPPPLPPGGFTMPPPRVWPGLAAARVRFRDAEARRQEALAAHTAASKPLTPQETKSR